LYRDRTPHQDDRTRTAQSGSRSANPGAGTPPRGAGPLTQEPGRAPPKRRETGRSTPLDAPHTAMTEAGAARRRARAGPRTWGNRAPDRGRTPNRTANHAAGAT